MENQQIEQNLDFKVMFAGEEIATTDLKPPCWFAEKLQVKLSTFATWERRGKFTINDGQTPPKVRLGNNPLYIFRIGKDIIDYDRIKTPKRTGKKTQK